MKNFAWFLLALALCCIVTVIVAAWQLSFDTQTLAVALLLIGAGFALFKMCWEKTVE